MSQYDVIVLGAGPSGLATAISIRRETRATVLVADAGPAERERFGESVAPDLLVPLKQLGLRDEFRAQIHRRRDRRKTTKPADIHGQSPPTSPTLASVAQ